MTDLTTKQCIPCSLGAPTMTPEEIQEALPQLDNQWEVIDDSRLKRTFKFKNFKEALAFVNRIGDLAEEQGHHPDIHLSWGKVVIEQMTHKIKGLHENDFIMAAKIDALSNKNAN